MILISAGLYTQKTALIILGCEFALLLYAILQKRGMPFFQTRHTPNTLFGSVSSIFCVGIILISLSQIFSLGQVFEAWDAIVSWDRWATIYASNNLPVDTHYYPQLLPVIISIPYVLINDNTIVIFSHRICLFFFFNLKQNKTKHKSNSFSLFLLLLLPLFFIWNCFRN